MPLTPEAGNTVAVVARGSGGNGSPRPNSTLPSPNSTTATRISTTRYSRTKVTVSILPDDPDRAREGRPVLSAQRDHRRTVVQRHRGGAGGVVVAVGEELRQRHAGVRNA